MQKANLKRVRIIENGRYYASHILRLFRERIKIDYTSKYKDELVGIITFVEPPRKGILYKADNWDYLGMTQGVRCFRRGDLGKWVNKEWTKGTQKHIYAKWLK